MAVAAAPNQPLAPGHSEAISAHAGPASSVPSASEPTHHGGSRPAQNGLGGGGAVCNAPTPLASGLLPTRAITTVMLSGPPRMLARSTRNRHASAGGNTLATAPISGSDTCPL